jgi:hypothetical protein
MANVGWERPSDRPLQPVIDVAEPAISNGEGDPYDATVERLLALLEENQAAIAALAQAWRHKSRMLEVTQAELAHTLEALAAERRVRRETAS